MKKVKAVILAAGEGVRMKSHMPKVLHKVIDKPMIEYVYRAADKAGIEDICVVVGHRGNVVRDTVNLDVTFINQKEQKGTGHAVMCAEEFFSDNCDVIILYGDTPLIKSKTIKDLIEFHHSFDYSATVISANIFDPTGYGRIIRNEDNNFLKIVEHKDATDTELLVTEINSGIYCFKSSSLHFALKHLKNNNASSEYYLTDCLSIILNNNEPIGVMPLADNNEILGVNNKLQLAHANLLMREYINTYHLLNGVTMVDPSQTYIGDDVSIGCDTIIYPQCFIEGSTKIGENCIIGPNCRIVDSILDNNVSVTQSVVYESTVGSDAKIGPFAYIRPNCIIGEKAKIGDFVEVKNSTIGNGSKAAHLTYIGDSDVGKGVNFGCGSVTVNYDGQGKYRTSIADNVFIGCNTNIIAPVTINHSAYTAAGSTITDDVPSNTLAIARAKQVIKHNWSIKK